MAVATKAKPTMTVTKHGKKVRGMTVKERVEEIQAFCQLCFSTMDEEDVKEICNTTGLCVSTIYRLQRGEVSLATHIGTIQAIGWAAGLKLELTETEARVMLMRK